MTYDIAIIGGGPAGLSAALNARARGKSAVVFTNSRTQNPLYRSPRIDNYPGMPNVSGARMLDVMTEQALAAGAELIEKRIAGAMDMGDGFLLTAGSDVYQSRALILATGVAQRAVLPGETELAGKGVSYCATCDGMLFRNRPVVVVGRASDAPEEANFLASIGCRVTYTGKEADRPAALDAAIPYVPAKSLRIAGTENVTAVLADGTELPCDCVFLLRETIAPARLLPGLALENGFVQVDRLMHTSLPGVFAAGDCTGKPLQAAKAAGEGLIAAQEAARFLDQ